MVSIIMTKIEIPAQPNVTLVAFYEKVSKDLKSNNFAKLIISVQDQIHTVLKEIGAANTFQQYDLEQVHATIIGCEGAKINNHVMNKWFWESRNLKRFIEFENLLQYFRNNSILPVVVRFGGYASSIDYGFTSQNLHPYIRSFQIKDDKTAILMGWPTRDGQCPLLLDQFRLGAQKYNVLHKFHFSPADVDNDCYLRVGHFKTLPDPVIRKTIETKVRETLTSMVPIYEIIDHTSLSIIQYNETLLALENTSAWGLEDITATEIVDLYPIAKVSNQ